MANFTTENNTYCFRIGPAFLDTDNALQWKNLYLVDNATGLVRNTQLRVGKREEGVTDQ